MDKYKHLYFTLFNKLTNLQNEITEIQQGMEELYLATFIDETEDKPTILYFDEQKKEGEKKAK
ncbi:hypothetical protein [Scatolibacter rhodanostii]|uniref:hypothetical protein n=1 Tax=Scatolibacter rhodanostii TaxID=2014781 RepID=UPI000C0704C7|nr:hypothetical protein [Scatolibacter rhodanostii]